MSALKTHCFAVGENTDVVPHNLFVSEGWPAMIRTLHEEIVGSSADWSSVEWQASDAVVESGWLLVVCVVGLDFVDPAVVITREGIATVLGPVPIETADSVSCLKVAVEFQV